MGMVTSRFTLDKRNAETREHLAERADFLGAIRLPAQAFQREGTAVVTDILFLRKREMSQEPSHTAHAWLETVLHPIEDTDVYVNRYFAQHPEMVLGDWTLENQLYGESGYSIRSNGNLEEQLLEAIEHLPQYQTTASNRFSTGSENTTVCSPATAQSYQRREPLYQ